MSSTIRNQSPWTSWRSTSKTLMRSLRAETPSSLSSWTPWRKLRRSGKSLLGPFWKFAQLKISMESCNSTIRGVIRCSHRFVTRICFVYADSQRIQTPGRLCFVAIFVTCGIIIHALGFHLIWNWRRWNINALDVPLGKVKWYTMIYRTWSTILAIELEIH